jgi:predicted glycosyltransferase
LRDILDSATAVRREWAASGLGERVLDYFDQVLVYGMREIFDPVEACGFPAALLKRTQFCGYIVNRQPSLLRSVPDPRRGTVNEGVRPVVLATTGGGEDGAALLDIFLRVAAEASWKGIGVAGPMTPENELAQLHDLASASDVTLHTGTSDLSGLLARADAIVCMGGYNTLVEALVQGVPAVCVPRTAPREEQAIRAATFQRLGLLRMLTPERLTGEALANAVGAALQTPRPELRARVRATLNLDGAARAACRLIALATAVRDSRSEAAVASG